MAEVIRVNPIDKTQLDTNKIKVAAYVRVSTDSNDQENSFFTQHEYYSNLIASNPKWQLADIYADNGITGTALRNRDEFNRMLADCTKGKIDTILVKSISRFARNTYECILMVRKLKSMGVNVIFQEQNLDTGKMTSELELTALSSMAQEESVNLSKNVRFGVHYRMKNGTYRQSRLPYGYTHGADGKWCINDSQAKIVRFVFDAYINGTSTNQIANELNRAEVGKEDGIDRWTSGTISYLLKNERYIGDELLQKSYIDGFPFKRHINHGERDMYYIKKHHVPIIEREEFEKVNERLRMQSNKFYRKASTEPQSIFAKMVYCEECGSTFRQKNGRKGNFWMCRLRDMGSQNCPTPQISEEMLRKGFINIYNRLVNNVDVILTPILTQLNEYKGIRLRYSGEFQNINNELANLTEQILILGKAYAEGYVESALYLQETNELSCKITKLKKEKKLMLGNDAVEETRKHTEQLIDVLNRFGPIGTFDEKAFARTVDRITISRERDLTYQLINGLKLKISYSEVG